MPAITTIAQLEEIYGRPNENSTLKVLDHLSSTYKCFIQAAPFVALASTGPEGLDCSPRGDETNVVSIAGDKTLLLPDWRGNNRIDSLKNIVHDPRVALMFMVPGSTSCLRVNGRAIVTADPEILAPFVTNNKLPRTVVAIDIEAVYFQCARAIMRAKLWHPSSHVDPKSLPTPGEMLFEASKGKAGGKTYDKDWPERAKKTMW